MNEYIATTLHTRAPVDTFALRRVQGSEMEWAAYLNPMIQGVNFAVHPEGATAMRAVVSVEVLKAYFGANDNPAGWLDVVRRHAGVLEWMALQQLRGSGTVPIVLTRRTVETLLRSDADPAAPVPGAAGPSEEPARKVRLSEAPPRLGIAAAR